MPPYPPSSLPTAHFQRLAALRQPLLGALAVLVASVLGAWLAYTAALNAGVRDLQASAVRRLDTVAVAMATQLARFDYLPALLETTPAVMALLEHPQDRVLGEQANRTLVRINAIAGADMLFVLDTQGTARAAADWDRASTTVGHNYSYRPYMQQALEEGRGRFFGIGATSGIPGYFLSYALQHEGRTAGVATVKINLDTAERAWATQPGEMLVSDEHGVVILSSRPAWKFRALRPLSGTARAQVLAQRPYPPDPALLPWVSADAPVATGQRILLDGAEHLVTTRALSEQRWQMQVLDPMSPAITRARTQAALTALAMTVAGLLGLAGWQSRRAAMHKLATQAALQAANDTLEVRVSERTHQLSSANARLADEVERRKQIEHSLHEAQAELVHAAKLAVLGQISAGLAHELNQPLAALHTLSDNAIVLLDTHRLPQTRGNLERISLLVGRLGEITRRLKTFAHKPGETAVPTPLAPAVEHALALLAERIRRLGVNLTLDLPAGLPSVRAEPTLLEQVLVNLLVNALDALAQVDDRHLAIEARVPSEPDLASDARSKGPDAPARVVVLVRDSGPGIASDMQGRLFEPFATSKPAGAGLGLGLMISRRIVRSFGGDLRAEPEQAARGAVFRIELVASTPVAPSGAEPADRTTSAANCPTSP